MRPSVPQLEIYKRAILNRLRENESPAVLGMENCVQELIDLYAPTIQNGENQSGILIGSCKQAKKCVLRHFLNRLKSRNESFELVYLNGVHLHNELEAFREILTQLSATEPLRQTLAYSQIYAYLKAILCDLARKSKSVLIVMDEIEKFVTCRKQLLLYNLVDYAHGKDVRIGILGVAENFNVMNLLESRVQSRFSGIQILIPRPTFGQVMKMIQDKLTLDRHTIEKYSSAKDENEIELLVNDPYVQDYGASLCKLLREDSKFVGQLQLEYDCGEPWVFFHELSSIAVSLLGMPTIPQHYGDVPVLSLPLFRAALSVLHPDHQLHILENLDDNAIFTLLTMAHLCKADQTYFTLEMVYIKWQQFYRKHESLDQMPTRAQVHLICQNLQRMQLVRDAGDAFNISRGKTVSPADLPFEYHAMRLNFPFSTLLSLIRDEKLRCTARTQEWALNGS